MAVGRGGIVGHLSGEGARGGGSGLDQGFHEIGQSISKEDYEQWWQRAAGCRPSQR